MHIAPSIYRRLFCLGISLAISLVTWSTFVPTAAAQALSANARQQIAEAVAFKESLSPAEQKLSTSLALAPRAAAHQPLGSLEPFVPSTPREGWKVEVTGHMSPSLLSSPAMRGVEKVNGIVPPRVFKNNHAVARVSASQLLELATHSDIQAITEALPAHPMAGKVTSALS